jgi:hypothetical protein
MFADIAVTSAADDEQQHGRAAVRYWICLNPPVRSTTGAALRRPLRQRS